MKQPSPLPVSPSPSAATTAAAAAELSAVAGALASMASRGYPLVMLAAIGAATLTLAALWPFADHQVLLPWYGVLVTANLLRWLETRDPAAGGETALARWKIRFTLASASTGLIWGGGAFLMIRDGSDPSLIFLSFALAGITGAVAALHAAVFSAAAAFQTAALLPFALRLADMGDRLHVMEAGTVLVYLAVLLVCSRRVHKMFKHTLLYDHQRNAIAAALMRQKQEFQSLAENIPDVIVRYDLQARRMYVNPALESLTGIRAEALLSNTPVEQTLAGFSPIGPYTFKLRQALDQGQPGTMEAYYERDGVSRVFAITIVPERDETGAVQGALSILRDITEAHAYQRHIESLAFYDSLTRLPNRTLFNERAAAALAQAEKNAEPLGLVMLDVDHFKEINDTQGHAIGDELLQKMGHRIQEVLGHEALVARLSGDEFAAVLPVRCHRGDLEAATSALLHAMAQPYLLAGRELFFSASIGLALYPTHGSDVATLVKHADTALHLAKALGRNNFQLYSPELTEKARERMALETDLRRSLANGELEVHYQAKVSLDEGAVSGAEALVRWRHPQRGLVSPDRFIPLAEQSGLIVDIGAWVFECACRTAAAWNAGGGAPRRIAVNFSPRQFRDRELKRMIFDTLQRTGCRPEWIEVEITEGLLLSSRDGVRALLDELHRAGISIAIDDFGTGYSALGYLNRFPIRTLKIDRSFVADLPGDTNNAALVEAILALCRTLKLSVVAEGVENEEQAQWLGAAGCDQGQGYLWSRPLPEAQFRARYFHHPDTQEATLNPA